MYAFVRIFVLASMLGLIISFPTEPEREFSISDELKKVLALLPIDKFKEIAETHLKNDTGFQAAVKYLQTDEWQNLIQTIREHPDTVAFKAYLRKIGIDVDVYLRCFEKFLKETKLDVDVPADAVKDLKPILTELAANIPTMKIIASLQEALMKSPKFQEVYDYLSSPQSQELVEKFRALDEVKRVIETLKGIIDLEQGIRSRRSINLTSDNLGSDWDIPIKTRNLSNIFNNYTFSARKNYIFHNKSKFKSLRRLLQMDTRNSREEKAMFRDDFFETSYLNKTQAMYIKSFLEEMGINLNDTYTIIS